jgi:hypothetical protein
MTIKDFVLFLGKSLGLFAIIRNTRLQGLRILCYHGIASSGTDESKFRRKIYANTETFARRLNWLARKKYNVLDLSQALELLEKKRLPRRAVVITFDEGFYSFYQTAFGLLREQLYPATVYVTSYYVAKQNPVFRLVVQYMLWKTTRTQFDLSEVDQHLSGEYICRTEKERDDLAWEIFRFAETRLDEEQRVELARRMSKSAKCMTPEWIFNYTHIAINSRSKKNAPAAKSLTTEPHSQKWLIARWCIWPIQAACGPKLLLSG